MINKEKINESRVSELKEQFNNALPYRFLVIDEFLDPGFANTLTSVFPSLDQMDVNYKGINERKSEHSNFDSLHPGFSGLRDELGKQDVINFIENISGISRLQVITDRYGYGLHQGGKNSFLDIHVDYNLHPVCKKQRRLNLIIFLNLNWEEEWGGALELWNRDMTACVQSISPVFNRAVLFECHDHSYHGYSKINCPESTSRKSFYQYYFSEPEKKLVFHDTIFRNKPSEGISKRILVRSKETIKNLVKRSLYHLGFNRFLK